MTMDRSYSEERRWIHRNGIHREPEGEENQSKAGKGPFLSKKEKAAKHGTRLRGWRATETDGDASPMPYYQCSVWFEIFIAVLMKAQVLQYFLRLPPKQYFPYIMHPHFSAGFPWRWRQQAPPKSVTF